MGSGGRRRRSPISPTTPSGHPGELSAARVTAGGGTSRDARGERKLVTMLFADLAGYTALAETLDPEEVYGFLRPTMAELQSIVESYGGTVPQVQGDGFMAIFGVPVAHEDDAERGVRAALAVRERVRELNEGRSGLSIP